VSTVVIDSSVALSWCFEDETSPETEAILDRVRVDGAVVPGLWHVEVANVLVQVEKRGRLNLSDVAEAIALLSRLHVAVDDETTPRAWREILNLARTESLTAYDASYLELAIRRGLALATKDRSLARAARRIGVAVLP
jgi:predicted nucleic acid-binding protein